MILHHDTAKEEAQRLSHHLGLDLATADVSEPHLRPEKQPSGSSVSHERNSGLAALHHASNEEEERRIAHDMHLELNPMAQDSSPESHHHAERQESYPAGKTGISHAHLAGLSALEHHTQQQEAELEQKRLDHSMHGK